MLMYRWFLSLLMMLGVLLSTQAIARDEIKLDYKFAPGDVVRYKVQEKTFTDKDYGPDTVDTNWEGILRLEVVKVKPDGEAEIKASYESGTMSMFGRTRAIKARELQPMTLRVSRNGKLLNAVDPDSEVGLIEMPDAGGREESRYAVNVYWPNITSIFQELPSETLKPHKTWDRNIEILGPLVLAKARYELSKAGKTGAVINRTVKQDSVDSSSIPPGTSIGNVREAAKMLFSLQQGCLTSIEGKSMVEIRKKATLKDGKATELNIEFNRVSHILLIPTPAP